MAIEIADGVFQLSPMPYVNVFALRGAEGWTIVDAAFGMLCGRLLSDLRSIGVGAGDVERIVLTHGHFDHAGGAQQLRDALGARSVLVGAADVDAVRAGKNASGEVPSFVAKFEAIDPGYRPVPSAAPLALAPLALDDGRTLQPVSTPGHTDGHLAFHLVEDRVLIGGDAIFNIFRMTPAPGFLCSDVPRNLQSIDVMADLEPSTLLLAHGSPVRGDVAGRLRTLTS